MKRQARQVDEERLLSGRAGRRVLGTQADVTFGAKHGNKESDPRHPFLPVPGTDC